MSIVTPKSMRAAYDFLRRISFSELRLPDSKRVTFLAKKMKRYHGYYIYPENIITLDSSINTVGRLLQVMAHEMIHVALEQNAACDHDEHDEHFNSLARIIEVEMGWPKGCI